MCTSVLLRTFNSVRWRRSVCSSHLWIFLRSAPVSSPSLTNMAWLSLAKTRCWKCSGREMWLQPAVWRETPMTQVWTLTWTLLHSTVTELRLTCVSCVSHQWSAPALSRWPSVWRCITWLWAAMSSRCLCAGRGTPLSSRWTSTTSAPSSTRSFNSPKTTSNVISFVSSSSSSSCLVYVLDLEVYMHICSRSSGMMWHVLEFIIKSSHIHF